MMYCKFALVFILLTCVSLKSNGQCTTLGQTPQTAFPVCGTSVFTQASVPICSNNVINVPGCSGSGTSYFDTNPFWYRFTCYKSGSLGFIIQPANPGDDYDWQLFDITGHLPQDVYTNNSLFVCGNWAGTYGQTGASTAGTANIECASIPSDNENTFSRMPTLIAGHVYILLVSHYTETQSGYSLSFGSGTAVITDTTKPALQSALADCGGVKIGIKLSKKMQCGSLAPDGSDFIISPALATVTSAAGNNCNSGFDMDSVVLTLSNALPAGNYHVTIKKGVDVNTLLDNCGNNIPVGDTLAFSFRPGTPIHMDSITPVGCSPAALQLVFKKQIMCTSAALNGTDFYITGPYPINVASVGGACTVGEGLSSTITLNLSSPIVHSGVYTIHLQKGTDGNTLIDECGVALAAGEAITFNAVDTVSAAFTLTVNHGCLQDTVLFSNKGGNSIDTWQWLFNDGFTDTLPNLTRIYKDSGRMAAQLIVSNGVCTDTMKQNFFLSGKIKAAFAGPAIICPLDTAVFKDASAGYVTQWNWYFGNGQSSTQQNPPFQIYPAASGDRLYPVQLITHNNVPCYDTTTHFIRVLYSCYIAVPSAFTPNGDGHNDYLYPLNAYNALNLTFRVFNRWGQQVFATNDWTHKWDGTIQGQPQASGVYVWMLSYTDSETGKHYQQKGTTVLIR